MLPIGRCCRFGSFEVSNAYYVKQPYLSILGYWTLEYVQSKATFKHDKHTTFLIFCACYCYSGIKACRIIVVRDFYLLIIGIENTNTMEQRLQKVIGIRSNYDY